MAILGHNGSGKSTFAKQINGILLPTDGTVWISGMSTADDAHIWDIRKTAGMVFQNPDNQIIGNIVGKMWDLVRKIWEYLRMKSGAGLTRAWRQSV